MGKTGQFLSVKADVSRAQVALAGTSKSLVSISRQTLGIIGKGTVKTIKREIKALTETRTGELLKAYRYKVRKDGTLANVFPKALNGEKSIFPKAMALSYGTKNGRLKALGFVQSGEKYAESDDCQSDIDKMIQKELAKYWS
jgi:hypothetical protein